MIFPTDDTVPGLVISSSRMIHVDSCQHVAGYIDGKRVRITHDTERPFLGSEHPDEYTQVLRFGPYAEVERRDLVDMRLKPSDLDHAYRRCRSCAPDVPEWSAPPGTRRRKIGNLTQKDIGRQTTEGELTGVMHTAERVLVEVGSRTLYGAPDDTIDFYIAQAAT